MAETLPDEVVREILLRVPTDAAALFRCAVTSKLWNTIVFDLSFLRHHWPENAPHPSSLLGFFDRPHDRQEPPFFYPISPPGSVFGARRRSLASFVSGAPDNILNGAMQLASRGGLLLVSLATISDCLHLAVCDLLTGTCDVLPPLECRVSQCGCVVLPREDCWSLHVKQHGRKTPLTTGYSAFFKVLAVVMGRNDQDCNLYTFSTSSETGWSEPRKCLDEALQRDTFAPRILLGAKNKVVVCHGVAYWLGSYSENHLTLPRYFIFGINVKTDQISITEVSIPTNELAPSTYFPLMLSVAVDGRLSLLHLQKEGLRLNTWTRGDDGAWLRTRVIGLKPPEQAVYHVHVAMLSGEKSGVLFMGELYGNVHKIDPKTGVMEDVTTKMFHDWLSMAAVPVEIDWPALFMSRLAK